MDNKIHQATMSYFLFTYKVLHIYCSAVDGLSLLLFYIEYLQPLKKSSHKNPRSEDALTPVLYFVGVRLRQMCNCVICFRPCQSNTESAGMPRLQTLVTRPDASNRLSHVTWVFRITLRSSVSKHLRFGISTQCRSVSFASAIPSVSLLPTWTV